MAVAQGYGKTVTSGSVFAYDTGDTRNSYVGEPTTNLALFSVTSGITFNADYAALTSQVADYNVTYRGRPSLRCTSTGQWNIYKYPRSGNYTATSSTVFTFSWKMKWSDGRVPAFSNGYIYTDAQYFYNAVSVTPIEDGWYLCQNIAGGTSSPVYLTGFTTTQYGTCYIADWQVEAKSHATSFTPAGTTRSATQGLLPLVGTSTVNLSTVSFNSNAQMTFDGTDDTLDLGIPVTTLAALSNFSMECVVKIDNYPSAASPNGYGSTTKKGVLLGATYYSGVAFYWAGNSSGTACNVHAYIRGADAQRGTGTYNLTPGSYHHLMLVNDRSNTTLSLYANGALISQVAGPSQEYNATLIPNAGNIGISKAQVDGGGTDVYSYLPVNVPVTKIYTRALSAGEVRQNYLHYKTRFNLS